jgi:acid phosphatase (class A)
MRLRILTLVACALALASAATAQQIEHAPQPAREHLQGYLHGTPISYRLFLAPPPAQGSLADQQDLAEVMRLQTDTSPERYALAVADSDYVYPQFEAAFGGPIDSAHSPKLVHLLNEALHDVSIPTFAAKTFFARLRPYQRLQLKRVCGEDTPPAPEPDTEDRSSYPSGHTTYGWTAALILAQVAPDRAPQILARAEDYGLSRVICAAHFPSDVAAGHALAATVVARLNETAAFRRDLVAVRAEHRGKPGSQQSQRGRSGPE